MNKHTPGKWKQCDKTVNVNGYICAGIQSDVPQELGGINMVAYLPYPCSDRTEANARLISACPELLEAVKAMLPWIEHAEAQAAFCYCALPNAVNIAIAQAKAAIAKAEGE